MASAIECRHEEHHSERGRRLARGGGLADYVERGRQADAAVVAIRDLRDEIAAGGQSFTKDDKE